MKNKKTIIALVILALVFILPYIGVIFYTLPRNDEFAGAFGIACMGGFSIPNVFKYVAQQYVTWEGNYSGVFLYSLFNPIIIGNSDSAVYITNCVCIIIFIVLWFYIIKRFLNFFIEEKSSLYILSAVTLIMSMNCRFMRETLGWFTGYMYYTIQLLLGTIGLIFVMNMCIANSDKKADEHVQSKKKTIAIMILAGLFEVIGSGGTLHISGLLCCLTMYLLIWAFLTKSDWIKALFLFVVTFLSTVVNAIAPGHYVRKDDYESISIFKALLYTAQCVYRELKRLCGETYFAFVMLGIFIALFFIIKTVTRKKVFHPVIVGGAGLACLIISTFPVCYGYGSSLLEARGYEILDLLIVVWSVLFVCSTVNWLMDKNIKLNRDGILAIVVMVVVLFSTVTINQVEIANIPSVECAINLANGSIKDYSDYWHDVLHQIERSQDEDVVIIVDGDYIDRTCMIDRCMFQEDETNWVNQAASVFYDHSTIRLVRE